MLFSSITFIYYFLPLIFIIYFIVPNKYKNLVLLFFSLLFYFLGEPKYIIILLLSGILNYIFGRLVSTKHKKIYLILAIIYNVGQLFIFKYTDFFISNINSLFNTKINLLYIVMPIGISFFTFQGLGYVIDVYNKKHEPSNNIIDFMTYLCLFPQLVAGPIVRYIDVFKELDNRTYTFSNFSLGIKRFIIGLSKKVLLANVLGEIAGELVLESVLSSWFKPILYTLQIYFDFSGYSDMAIGLGKMFGFNFLENFNYPLIASSITDFWRRWHISLSSWFRDYIYIPLGGNRVGKLKLIRNIFVVWGLTGFWHGASWNFIVWGLYFGIILVIEKFLLKKYLDKTRIIKYIYSIIIIIISFLIFSVTDMKTIFRELSNMFFINNIPFSDKVGLYHLKSNIILIIISIISATPLLRNLISKIEKTRFKIVIDIIEPIVLLILLTLSTAFLIDASFNPFLYFRF